jgi:hypothetical protein
VSGEPPNQRLKLSGSGGRLIGKGSIDVTDARPTLHLIRSPTSSMMCRNR